jgi:hypothetical protein
VPTALSGVGYFSDTTAILNLDGHRLKLVDVRGRPDQVFAAARFVDTITNGSGEFHCVLAGEDAYECRAVATNVRLSAGLVANGFALAAPGAPTEYAHWEWDARANRRGMWAIKH